ncbi:MAG: preprotein translocase subunit SecG [Spirochaetaceae bacterium]|jgi:preprotein translocase subunit SecG|nr:preprotein translocase subunit SecG [Spirochaetaceae bacterium]
MGILNGFLLVLFIIVAVLMVLLVLVQNEDGDTMGGVFGGGSNTAFGSRSGNILTKTSSVLGALFFILAFSLALLNRTPSGSGVEAAGRQSGGGSDWFLEDSGAPDASAPEPAVVPETAAPEVPEAAEPAGSTDGVTP